MKRESIKKKHYSHKQLNYLAGLPIISITAKLNYINRKWMKLNRSYDTEELPGKFEWQKKINK